MQKIKLKKLANSFYSDLEKDLKRKEFRKNFYGELLKLQVAEEIVKLRKKYNLSQKGLANKIDTTQAVISRIENAQVCASTNILKRICDNFEIKAKFEFQLQQK